MEYHVQVYNIWLGDEDPQLKGGKACYHGDGYQIRFDHAIVSLIAAWKSRDTDRNERGECQTLSCWLVQVAQAI